MKNENQKVGDLGQHWTPKDVVQTMLTLKKNKGLTLEPSAGSGRFVEVLDNVVAIEIDEKVVPDNLKDRYIISNFFEISEEQKFQTVIGNPPYVAGKLLTPEWFCDWKGVLPRTANAYLHMIDKCVNHLEESGELIFIVPSSVFSDSSRGKELRKKMVTLGAFTDVIFCHEQIEWENAAVDTLIFRWERGAIQEKVKTNRGPKTLFESGGFIWLIDFTPMGTLGELFKATVGSAPSRASAEAGYGEKYFREGKFVLIDESYQDAWPRVHNTPEGPKIFYVGGPIRRWPVFFEGTSSRHLDNALLPKSPINTENGAKVLNDWFKANGDALGLIKGGRWSCGVKQFENCPIPKEVFNNLKGIKSKSGR
jgi:hypothetical protein